MIISVINQKGGVAKTTSTFNLAECLSQMNKKVLMIDLDPQASLTISAGVEPEELENTIYDILCEGVNVEDTILNLDKYYLIPSIIDLSVAEMQLISEFGREYLLKNAINPIVDRFDYILIDCPPSLGLLSINALSVCDKIIIPVATEYLALRGMKLLINTINKIKTFNSTLEILGIIPTMYDPRTLHSNEVLENLKEEYSDLVLNPITKSVKVNDAVLAANSIVAEDPNHKISKAYKNIAEVIING